MNYHCPNCNEIIYNRTRKVCSICGTPLSREMLPGLAKPETSAKKLDAQQGDQHDKGHAGAEEQKQRDGKIAPS
jgi:ribosomal protein L37E